jgi:LuxR family transcriptional regulator, maltose regulon positive regulatory protein
MPIDATDWIIRSKLDPPKPARSVIERIRLVRAGAGSPARVTLVEAPPGYGKTVLLAEWHAHARPHSRTGWISLDEHDREPLTFLRYLVAAGLRAGVPLHSLEAGLRETAKPSPQGALAQFVARIEADGTPFLLFLDDYHRAESRATNALLEQLIGTMPDGVRLVLGVRSRPNVPLTHLRAQGHLQEFHRDDLRFTPDEIRTYVARPDLDVSELAARTEGWPMALQLWILSGGESIAQVAPSARAGDIAAYLTEQVLDRLPHATQLFLEQTAILERLNGDLANALCGIEDGWAVLDQLSVRNLFLVPLDDARRWFRYHHLFAEFLRERLWRRSRALVPELHRRAADWFAGEGLLSEAVAHARQAADPDYALHLIEKVGGWRLAIRGGQSVLRTLSELHGATALHYPRVKLGQIYLAAQDGSIQWARRELQFVADATDGFTAPDGGRQGCFWAESRFLDFLISYYEDRLMPPDQLEALERTFLGIQGLDPAILVGVRNFLCISQYGVGDFESCAKLAGRCISASLDTGLFYAEIYLYVFLGLARFEQGQIRQAEHAFQTMHARAATLFGDDSNLASIARLLLAGIEAEAGRFERAAELFARSLEGAEHADGFFDILAFAYPAAIAVARRTSGGRAVAALLERAEATALRRELPRLHGFVRILRSHASVEDSAGFDDDALRALAEGGFVQGPRHKLQSAAALTLAERQIRSGAANAALQTLAGLKPALIRGAQIAALVRLIGLEAAASMRAGQTDRAGPAARGLSVRRAGRLPPDAARTGGAGARPASRCFAHARLLRSGTARGAGRAAGTGTAGAGDRTRTSLGGRTAARFDAARGGGAAGPPGRMFEQGDRRAARHLGCDREGPPQKSLSQAGRRPALQAAGADEGVGRGAVVAALPTHSGRIPPIRVLSDPRRQQETAEGGRSDGGLW